MKKIIVYITIAACFFVTSCGKNTVDFVTTEESVESSEMSVEIIDENKEMVETDENEPEERTETITVMYASFDDVSCEEFVAQKNAENDGCVYSVYNDDYYNIEMKYSEYVELKEYIKTKDMLNKDLGDLFSNEQYGGAFISMEYDDLFQDIKLIIDSEAFNQNYLACVIGSQASIAIVSDYIQAVEKIDISERKTTITYQDVSGNVFEIE